MSTTTPAAIVFTAGVSSGEMQIKHRIGFVYVCNDMVTLCNKPLAVLVLLLSIVTASLIEPDLLETCLKDLHQARISLIEGGEEALVQTVLEQYNKTGSPETMSSYVFCFSIPENETDNNGAPNWEVREVVMHPYYGLGSTDGERYENRTDDEMNNPVYGHAVVVNDIMQAGIEHKNEGYYVYGYYINLTHVMNFGENTPANAVRREYVAFATDSGGRLIDCGCPVSNATSEMETVEVST